MWPADIRVRFSRRRSGGADGEPNVRPVLNGDARTLSRAGELGSARWVGAVGGESVDSGVWRQAGRSDN